MPVTLEHVSSRIVQQKLNTKGIRTWDTIQYLSALDGAHKRIRILFFMNKYLIYPKSIFIWMRWPEMKKNIA